VSRTWHEDLGSEADTEAVILIAVTTETDEHDGHDWEAVETLADNAIEYTRWAYCSTCRKEFKERSVEWANYDEVIA
jgi:hypothetical protein